jgi:hypothetical protein
MRASDDGNYDALVDPRLGQEYNGNEMARMIACAAACVRHSARRRPRMSQVPSCTSRFLFFSFISFHQHRFIQDNKFQCKIYYLQWTISYTSFTSNDKIDSSV